MTFNVLEIVRKPVLNLSIAERKKLWLMPFIYSYLVVFVGYLCMYLIRKNFNISQNHLIEAYGLTKTNLGYIALTFSIVYGLGKMIVGYYATGKNTKNLVAVLLILSAFSTIGFGFSLGGAMFNIVLMSIFYGMNGFFQSAGGPASLATITKWTAKKNRGTFLGLWNMSHNFGGALAAGVAIFGMEVVFAGDIRGMFLFPAILALVVGIIGLYMGNDSPESYGLGKSEELFDEKVHKDDIVVEENKLTKKEIFFQYIIKNPYIWILCIANIFVYIIRIGVDQWSVVYGREVLGFSKEVAISGFTMFEVGAIFGTILWGFLSDLAKGRRAIVSIVALFLILFVLGIYQTAGTPETFKMSLFALGFLIFGPQLLLGVSLVGFVPKNAVTTADGMKGMFAYLLGDSFAKIGLAMMADNKVVFGLTGWDGTFTAIYASVFISMAMLLYVAFGEEKRIREG